MFFRLLLIMTKLPNKLWTGFLTSNFNKTTTMKNAIITGATSGIGYETALHLAKLGWKNGITYRDEIKGMNTISLLKEKSGNKEITGFLCDLQSFNSIKQCSSNIASEFPQIDVLINNAGTWETTFKETPDGKEQMFMVNFIAPVYQTKLLHPQLKKSDEARVINVSSAAHMMGKIVPADPESRIKYRHIGAYGNSKLNILLATKTACARLCQRQYESKCIASWSI